MPVSHPLINPYIPLDRSPRFAVFGIYLTALSNALNSSSQSSTHDDPNASDDHEANTPWLAAPLRALDALAAHTPARPGDRTLVDALHPFSDALAHRAGLTTAVSAARAGAESTRGMAARLGRATYVRGGKGADGDEEEGGEGLPPDPGAWGVAAILEGFMRGLRSEEV